MTNAHDPLCMLFSNQTQPKLSYFFTSGTDLCTFNNSGTDLLIFMKFGMEITPLESRSQ
jgi:hypothetical protein